MWLTATRDHTTDKRLRCAVPLNVDCAIAAVHVELRPAVRATLLLLRGDIEVKLAELGSLTIRSRSDVVPLEMTWSMVCMVAQLIFNETKISCRW